MSWKFVLGFVVGAVLAQLAVFFYFQVRVWIDDWKLRRRR
jgi:hypothetical protein